MVTLFRVYPDGVDTFSVPELEMRDASYRDALREHNEYNRRIFEHIQSEALQGRGVILSLTDCYRETDYGEPVVALKSYLMSPFSDNENVVGVLDAVWKAREAVAGEQGSV
jgi:hypothetical protein